MKYVANTFKLLKLFIISVYILLALIYVINI